MISERVFSLLEYLYTDFFTEFTALGSLFLVWIIPVAAYLQGDREFSFSSLRGILTVSAVVYPLKFLIDRPRPSAATEFMTPSFPSGHTAVAFTMAFIIADRYPKLKLLMYTVATLVGVSRVVIGVHYPTDVLAGAIVGLAAGYIALNYRRIREKFLSLSED